MAQITSTMRMAIHGASVHFYVVRNYSTYDLHISRVN